MARAPDERIKQAKAMYLKGLKLVEIASQISQKVQYGGGSQLINGITSQQTQLLTASSNIATLLSAIFSVA